MKKIFVITLPLLLSACGGASTYQQECADKYERYSDAFTCTKSKLYNDPRVGFKGTPAYTSELVAYGEELNSQLRQQLITDKQAKELFARKITELNKRYEATPPPAQPAIR